MSDFTLELKRFLTSSGCYRVRQGKGDHEIWYSPISKRRFVVDARIKSRHTANAVLKQAGGTSAFDAVARNYRKGKVIKGPGSTYLARKRIRVWLPRWCEPRQSRSDIRPP
jgi:hypothetical protein